MIEFSRRLGHKIRLPRRIGLNEGNFSLYLLCRLPPYHAGTTLAACNCAALVSAPALNLPIKSTIIFIRVGRPGGRPECARIAGLPTGRRPARPLTRKLVFIRTFLTLRFFRIAGFRGAFGHSDREFALIRWAQSRKSDSLTIRLNGRDLFCDLWVAQAAAPRSRESPAGCDPLQRIVPLFVRATGSLPAGYSVPAGTCGSRAISVRIPVVFSPISTQTSLPNGRNTSTREPNLINPHSRPRSASNPSCE